MMPTGNRSARLAVFAAKLLVLVLLAVSPRALLAPTGIVHKSQDSKRPKTPKNVVRAEPVRIPGAEKQGHSPGFLRTETGSEAVPFAPAWALHPQTLPVKAFTQLTRPDYLKTGVAALPSTPLAPPA